MPLEQTPSKLAPWPPLPSNDPKGRVPEAFPVNTDPNESFWTIASKTGVEATDLVRYNFLTNKPEEINWYLKTYVGCTVATSDGKNYKFQGATYQPAANKGVIFIPRAASAAKPPAPGPQAPIKGLVPVPPDQFTLDPNMLEFAFSRDFPEIAAGWVRYKPSISGKVKFGPDSSNKIAVNFADGKIKDLGGSAVVKNFLDFADLTVGFKWKLEDLTSRIAASPKKLAVKLGEALEATFKAAKIPIGDHGTVELDLGATLSTTPFVAKFSGTYFGKTDIGPALGLNQPYIVKLQLTFQVSFKVGPGPLFAQALAQADAELAAVGGLTGATGAAFVAFAFVGFISFGAWYGGDAARRGDRLGLASWYISGYMYQSGFQPSIDPTTDLNLMRLVQAGKDDAIRDAETNFPGSVGTDAIRKWMMLWILGAGGPLGSMDGFEKGRILLREYLYAKLKNQFGY